MSHGGFHGGGFRARGRRFYGGDYYVDPFVIDVLEAPPSDGDDDGGASGDDVQPAEGDDSAVASGGPLDHMADLVAEHETYWSEIVARHPDSDLMRWWMTDRWSPFFVDWTDLLSRHGLSDVDIDVLAGLLQRLNRLRGEAKGRGIPLPREGAGVEISGLHISRPHATSIPEAINDETDRRFWERTGYKSGQKLDRNDPDDARMILEWIRIRYDVAQETAQNNEVPMSADHEFVSGPALIVGRGGATRRRGGGMFGGGDADPSLLDLAPVVAPGARGAHASIGYDRDTHHVSAHVTVDGCTYTGHADLSHVMGEIAGDVAGYHHALHGNANAPAAIGAVAHQANAAIAACGDALVGAALDNHRAELCAGWWHDLTRKVKNVAHKVVHLPQEAIHIAAHPPTWLQVVMPVLSPTVQKYAAEHVLGKQGDALFASYQKVMDDAASGHLGAKELLSTVPQIVSAAGAAGLDVPPIATQIATAAQAGGGDVGKTLQNLAGPIASAASQAAGAQAGPAAASLTTALVDAATGSPNVAAAAQQALSQAQTAAAQDPQAKAVLDAAHQAVAQTTAAYHVAQTAADAAAGSSDAQAQVAQLAQAATDGDPAAAQLVNLAQGIGDTVTANNAADAAVSNGIADLRGRASQIARTSGGQYVGVDLDEGGIARTFASLDLADDWLARREQAPHVYLAIFDATDPTWPAPISESAGPEAAHHVGGFVPLLLATGAGLGAGYYFGPAIHERLAKWFPKAFGAGATKVSGGGRGHHRQRPSQGGGGDGGSDALLIASGLASPSVGSAGNQHVMIGSGDCGARMFAGVDRTALDRIFQRLHDKGAEISGSNPWSVDTHDHGVILHGSWDGSGQLTLAVTDSDLLAPCGAVWDALESMLQEVGAKEIAS